MKHLTTVIFKAIQAERLLGMLCCFFMLLFSSSTSLLAQGEAANWYFGNGAGLSFNSGNPVAFSNSALNAGEGVSSISDAAGNALMYTDGLDLYNRNDVVMPNGAGLLGGSSSSQSAVIIRKPLSNSLYYLFTADQDAEPDGIRYSIVNMTLNAGLGDITATKNVLLHAPATEKLTAVMHCNKRDVWIIAHDWGSNDFMAWLLTPAGLSASPVISSVGTVQNQSVIGCMKVSPDGQKLAFAVFDPSGTDYVQLFDFDPSTGSVNNPATFPSTGNCYGVEFSPNSRFLYYTASVSGSVTNIQILQADLCAGTNADIITSSVSVGASSNGFIRSLQLGPDGKLYFARFFQNEIGVIDFPDLPAPACGFNVSGVTLSPGAQCKAGLPNFNQSFFKNTTPFNVSQNCLSATFDANSIAQAASCNNPIQSYSWNFGEPSAGASNTSSLQQVAHTYATPGTYQVRLIVQYFCRADTLLQSIDVNCGPQVQVNSGSVCSGACFSLQATAAGGTPPYTYSWSNGLGTSAGPIQVCPSSTTHYIVTLTDAAGQTSKDTSIVTVSSVPVPTVVNQSPSCHGATNGSVTVNLSGGPYTYQWAGYPNQTGATLSGLSTGSYSAIISNALGCQQAISSTLIEPATLSATVSTINSACSTANGSATVTATGGTAPYTYNWVGFSPAAATHSILPVGSFNVIVTDAHGCSVNESYTIATLSAPSISIQELNPVTCHAGANGALGLQISGGQAPYQYQWSNGGSTANINGLSAGTYTISVNDANGCMAIDSYTLTEPVAISLTVTAQTANCGLSNGSASAMVSGAFSPISINWTSIPTQTGNTASNLATGNYSATITDAHGCSTSTNFSIGNTPGPIVSSYGTPVSCFGANDGTASVSVITGNTYQVTWSNGQTGTQITGLAPGTYTATVSTSTGCISTSSYTVGSPSTISLSLTASSSTCGTANGSVSANVIGGLAPYTYVWTGFPAQTSAVLNNLSSGSYSLQVSDANGCTTNGNATVSSQNGPSIQVVLQQAAACFGASNGSASVAVSGGVAPIAITWSNGATGTIANGLLAGNYVVTAVDAIGCTAVSTIVIGQPAAILASTTSTNASCGLANGTATLNVSGGTAPYSYSWSSGAITSAITASSGNYSVQVTDAHACSVSLIASISSSSSPSVSIIGITQVSCFQGNDAALQANVSGGTAPYTYHWSNNATASALNGVPAGNYSVTITDASLCTASASVQVIEPSAWNVNATINSSTCGNPNGSVHLSPSGASAPYSIVWSTGSTGAQLNNVPAGIYSVTISDGNGCVFNNFYQVADAGGLSLNVINQTDALCAGAANGSVSVQAIGGTSPYTYLWSDGGTGASRSTLLAGNYSITVQDVNGCQASASITLSEAAALIGTITSSPSSCGFANGTAQAIITGGTQPYVYSWDNGSQLSSCSGLLAGNVNLSVIDANGCVFSSSVIIGSAAPLTVAIVQTDWVTCPSDANAAVQAAVNGGTAPYSYAWSDGSSLPVLTGISAGNYSLVVNDANGCSASASIQILEPAAWNVSANIQSSTCGNPNGAILLSISGASAPYTALWSTGVNTPSLTAVGAGIYSVTLNDANQCVYTAFYQVSDAGGLSLQIQNQTDALCAGASNGTADVQAIGGTSPFVYSWSDGGIGASRTNLNAGIYAVTVSDANACQATASVTISEPTALTGNVTTTPASCGNANASAQIQVTGGNAPYSYAWSNGATTSSLTGLGQGLISVNVTDANGCVLNVSASVSSLPALSVGIVQVQPLLCNGDATAELTTTVSGGMAPYTYQWSDASLQTNLLGASAGTYSVTVTDASACSTSATIQVLEPSAWAVNASIQSSTCGNPNGAIQLTISGATAPYSALWSDGSTGLQLNQVVSGIYAVTLNDANGCVHTASYQVTDAGGLSLNVLSQTDALCAGAANGTALVQAIGGTAPYVYQWDDGSVLPQNTALAAGDYAVSVTDLNGCVALADVHIQEAAPLQLALTTSNGTCGLYNATASVSVSGGTAPYSYSWTNGALTSSVTGLGAGSVGVQVTDAHACSSSSSASVAIAAALQASVAILQGVSCFGNADAIVEIQGSTALQAQWSNGQTGLQASHLAAGNYSVIGIEAGTCRDTVNFSIAEPAALQTQLSVQNATCTLPNGSASVQVIGGTLPYAYSWSNGATTAVNSALSVGPIALDVTDANGCSMHASAQVQSIQLLHIDSFQLIPVSCYGLSDGTAQVVVSGAVGNLTYAWSSGSNTNQALGLAAGYYSLMLEDAAGCSQTASFTISAPAALQVSIQTSDVSCAGGSNGTASATVSGGVAPYQFAWDGLSSNTAFTAGTHTLLLHDANGCAVQSNFQINEPSALTLQLSAQTPRCGLANGSISTQVTGGTLPYSYQWNTGSTQSNLSHVGNGNYTATVTDANGCSALQSQTFADPGAPVLQLLSSSNISCAGWSDGAIAISTTGGTGAYSYTWSNSNLTGTNIASLYAGNYSVEVLDELLCRDTLNITLTEPQALQLSLSAQAVTCAGGSNGLVNAQVSGGTAPYTYAWSNATSSAQLNQVQAGNYALTLIDAHACSINANVEVTEPLPLSGNIVSHAVLCNGEASGWAEVAVNGGIAPYTYAWSSGSTDSSANSLAAGTHQVIIRDANACLLNLQTEILQPEALHVNFSGMDKLCFGDSALLMAASTGGVQPYSYFWNAQLGAESYLWHADSTHYELLLAIDANGCRDSIKRELLVYALPQAGISFAEREICAGECVTLTAMTVDGGVYSWSDSRQAFHTGQSVSFCYEDSGAVYMQLHVSDLHGCSSTWQEDAYIEVHPLPVVGFSPNHMTIPLLDALVYFENTSTGAVSYQWDFNPRSSGEESAVSNPYFQFTEVGDYPVTLTAINEFGCASSLERTITVTKDFAVYFPNAFTPNADGMNDRFMPSGTGIDTDQFNMQIYNRWGQMVYETSTWGQGWDGTFLSQQGIKEEAGAELFVWQMLITDFKGLTHDYRGSVMLVR